MFHQVPTPNSLKIILMKNFSIFFEAYVLEEEYEKYIIIQITKNGT